MKHTKEKLEPLVASSLSIADVLRGLGLRLTGGSYRHIGGLLSKFGIDTSHFQGKLKNSGPAHRGGNDTTPWQEVLVRRPVGSARKEAFRLRRALIESGVPYICAECKIDPVWRGEELRLHVEHCDGDHLNNEPTNLKFLCPNCHQVFGWKKSPVLHGVTSVAAYDRDLRKRKKSTNALVAKSVDASV